MVLVYKDRVAETTATTGTGAYDLSGAKTGFQGFVAAIGNANTCYYCCQSHTEWEVGIGTIADASPDTLTRTTILASSNAGNAVDWPAGTKDIFGTMPASAILSVDRQSNLVANTAYAILDQGTHTNILLGGNSTYSNYIGTTGKPTGVDFAPTGWTNDAGYVDNAALVASVLGGHDNVVNSIAGIVVGGGHNFVKYDANGHSIIGGGSYHVVEAGYSGIFSGRRNTITGGGVNAYSVIGGGDDNNIVGRGSVIVGGTDNDLTGDYSVVGGTGNRAGSYSYLFGNNIIGTGRSGVTAFTDGVLTNLTPAVDNQFLARFANGYLLSGGAFVLLASLGINATTPGASLDVAQGLGVTALFGADNGATTRTNATNKYARLGAAHYTNAEEPLALIVGASLSTGNTVQIGGGASALNAAMVIAFFTAANATTTTGTERMRIASDGKVGINETVPDYLLDVNGAIGFTPGASVTPVDNGDVVIEATNNTTLTFKLKGSDGTVRSGTLTLA